MRQSTRLLTSTSLICSMLLGLMSSSVLAQNTLPLPEGQTLITLTVTERARVGQDTLTADRRIEVDDADPAVVQNRINAAMAEALELTDGRDEVSVATGY